MVLALEFKSELWSKPGLSQQGPPSYNKLTNDVTCRELHRSKSDSSSNTVSTRRLWSYRTGSCACNNLIYIQAIYGNPGTTHVVLAQINPNFLSLTMRCRSTTCRSAGYAATYRFLYNKQPRQLRIVFVPCKLIHPTPDVADIGHTNYEFPAYE